MLFDLRGAGRRTTVKVVYLTLAILMGGGLVLFGIGGDVSGGLVDAITEQGSTSTGTGRYEDRVREAERRTRAQPQNAAAWAELARARFTLATVGGGLDQQTGQFTAEGRRQLNAAAAAWERHLKIAGDNADDSVANVMVQAYSQQGLNEPEKAVRAQEIITEARPRAETFAALAVLSYQAGQTRKGDLARGRALDLADKSERNTIKAEIDQAKQAALTQQVQDATQQAPPTPTPEAGGGGSKGGGKNDKD